MRWPFAKARWNNCMVCTRQLENGDYCCDSCCTLHPQYQAKISSLPSEAARRSLIAFLEFWAKKNDTTAPAWGELLFEWLVQSSSGLDQLCTQDDWIVIADYASEDWHPALFLAAVGFGQLSDDDRQSVLSLITPELLRMCFEALPGLPLEIFLHTEHAQTILDLLPPYAWTDAQLLDLLQIANQQVTIPPALRFRIELSDNPKLKRAASTFRTN